MVSIIANPLNVIVVEEGTSRSTEYAKADYTFSVTTKAFWLQEDAGDLQQRSINFVDILSPEFDRDNPDSLLIILGLLAAPVEPNATVNIGDQPVQVTTEDLTVISTHEPFSVDYGTKGFSLPSKEVEYVLFLFRAKSNAPDPEGLLKINEIFISALSNTNDDTLIRICINPVITGEIQESWWEKVGIGSKMEYIRPFVEGISGFNEVPPALIIESCLKRTLAKYIRDKAVLSERMQDDFLLPTDGSLVYGITITSITAGAKIWAAISLVEEHIVE